MRKYGKMRKWKNEKWENEIKWNEMKNEWKWKNEKNEKIKNEWKWNEKWENEKMVLPIISFEAIQWWHPYLCTPEHLLQALTEPILGKISNNITRPDGNCLYSNTIYSNEITTYRHLDRIPI